MAAQHNKQTSLTVCFKISKSDKQNLRTDALSHPSTYPSPRWGQRTSRNLHKQRIGPKAVGAVYRGVLIAQPPQRFCAGSKRLVTSCATPLAEEKKRLWCLA